MTITVSQIEAELQTEFLTCSEGHIPTRTLPAENIPAQALRYGIHCGHVFYIELPPLHLSNAFYPRPPRGSRPFSLSAITEKAEGESGIKPSV